MSARPKRSNSRWNWRSRSSLKKRWGVGLPEGWALPFRGLPGKFCRRFVAGSLQPKKRATNCWSYSKQVVLTGKSMRRFWLSYPEPNKGMQATAASVRSSVAPASRRG